MGIVHRHLVFWFSLQDGPFPKRLRCTERRVNLDGFDQMWRLRSELVLDLGADGHRQFLFSTSACNGAQLYPRIWTRTLTGLFYRLGYFGNALPLGPLLQRMCDHFLPRTSPSTRCGFRVNTSYPTRVCAKRQQPWRSELEGYEDDSGSAHGAVIGIKPDPTLKSPATLDILLTGTEASKRLRRRKKPAPLRSCAHGGVSLHRTGFVIANKPTCSRLLTKYTDTIGGN